MCGIAGYIGNKNNFPNQKQIRECKHSLYNRGPDANETFEKKTKNKSILFVHTRLSIIDLSKNSNQPFSDDQGILIFNGMIYNYVELKKLLQKKGQKFKTNSDTEVLLKMLNVFKERAFEMLDGMWVLSYYNFKRNEIIISRDRFGEKPLFYFFDKQNFFFSNSIKALQKLMNKKLNFDNKKIKDFLCYPDKVFGSDNKTFFKNIYQFPKASYLKIKLGKPTSLNFHNYWRLKIKNDKKTFIRACKDINKLIKDVIKTRVRSDVLNSVLVSGGLDSNTIVSQAKKISKINGYTLVSTDQSYDETKLIKISEKFNGFKTNFISSKKTNSLNLLEKMVEYGYSPLLTPSAFALALLCEKIRKDKNRVLLTGIGGDEIFCGYYVNYLSHILSYKNKQEQNEKFLFWKNNIKKYIRNDKMKDFDEAEKKENRFRLNYHIEGQSVIKNYIKNYKKIEIKKLHKDIFYNNMLQNIHLQSIPSQIYQSDYVSMFFSLENRSPFLSKNLFEYIFKLNKNFFMYKGKPKAMLRQSMKKNFPKIILNNYEKTGFYSPFSSFFKKKDFIKIQKYLNKSHILKKNLNMKNFKKLVYNSLLHTESKFIFACLNIAILEKTLKKSKIL